MTSSSHESEKPNHQQSDATQVDRAPEQPAEVIKEFGGPKGPEPTRFGDWERKGRCVDF